ncbi:MAG: peptidoglycan-binding domain-containing protein [bacterium]|nr:peptidoglycan-binding domain-containing protein [bacterium]
MNEWELKETILLKKCEFQRLIRESVKSQVKSFESNLSFGMRSEKVKQLQLFLIGAGDLDYGLDTGFFGTKTKQALVKYQKDRNIMPASGYFGPKTRVLANAFLLDNKPEPFCW